MLRIISGSAIAQQWDVMEAVWRFRHRHFVERFGWEGIRQPDGREIDQFDTPDAIHLALLSGRTVVGYTRLLPTSKPHLLSDVYPHLMCGRDWPQGFKIYEWTRCVAEEGNLKLNGVPVSHLLMTGVMEFCLVAGIASVIVETHPKLVNLLMQTGWDVRFLAEPSILDGKPVAPIEAVPSAAGLMKHQRMYQMEGSILELDAPVPNPLSSDTKLSPLTYLAPGAARSVGDGIEKRVSN